MRFGLYGVFWVCIVCFGLYGVFWSVWCDLVCMVCFGLYGVFWAGMAGVCLVKTGKC